MFDIKLTTTRHTTACGPACLKMLLDYYGVEVPLETLIEECGITVNGCSVATLKRVAQAHGLDASIWKEPPGDVLTQDRPGIVWWRYTHYVVYGGLNDKGEPVLFNPSRGRYAIDAGTFAVMATGIEDGTCVVLSIGKPLNLVCRAETDYQAREVFTVGDRIFVAKEIIAKGETIAPGVNCEETTTADMINMLKEQEGE